MQRSVTRTAWLETPVYSVIDSRAVRLHTTSWQTVSVDINRRHSLTHRRHDITDQIESIERVYTTALNAIDAVIDTLNCTRSYASHYWLAVSHSTPTLPPILPPPQPVCYCSPHPCSECGRDAICIKRSIFVVSDIVIFTTKRAVPDVNERGVWRGAIEWDEHMPHTPPHCHCVCVLFIDIDNSIIHAADRL